MRMAGAAIFAVVCFAQAVLNNDAIIKMVKAGLGEDIVLSTIKAQPGQYATSADDLIALKKAGVPDKILAAIMEKGSAPAVNPPAPAGGTPAPAAAAPAPNSPIAAAAPAVSEVGVYYNKAGA